MSSGLVPAASDKDKVSFYLLKGETGHRLKQYVDSETGEIVDRENRVKGYEVGKGDYVTVIGRDRDRTQPHHRYRKFRAKLGR